MTCGLAQVRNGHRRRCPAPLQGWEWNFGEGISQGAWGALVVREETKTFLLEEKMPDHKCVLCLVSWCAGSVGFVGFGFKHRLCYWSIYSVTGHVS